MVWDGIERRKLNRDRDDVILNKLSGIEIQIASVGFKVDKAATEIKQLQVDAKYDNEKIRETIYGNGKPGITNTLSILKSDFDRHDKSDSWIHRTVIGVMIAMIGGMVKLVFFHS